MPICLDPNQEVPLTLDHPAKITVRPLTSRKFIERQNLWVKAENETNPEELVRLLDEMLKLYLARVTLDGKDQPIEQFLADGITQKGKWAILNTAAETTELDAAKKNGSAFTPESSPGSNAPSASPPASA